MYTILTKQGNEELTLAERKFIFDLKLPLDLNYQHFFYIPNAEYDVNSIVKRLGPKWVAYKS